jgi:DnaJ-class molecular chaperone
MDYYQILGVSRSADLKEVRRAFRNKAKQLHPDINNDPVAHHQFQKINEAYQVLQNEEKRKLYDLQLLNGFPAAVVYYRPGKVRYRAKGDKYAHYRSKSDAEKRYDRFEKIFDFSLLFFVFMLGCLALLYGISRLFITEPDENVDPYTGIVMGVIFVSVFSYLWVNRRKASG